MKLNSQVTYGESVPRQTSTIKRENNNDKKYVVVVLYAQAKNRGSFVFIHTKLKSMIKLGFVKSLVFFYNSIKKSNSIKNLKNL